MRKLDQLTVSRRKMYCHIFHFCLTVHHQLGKVIYEGWNFNSGNYLFTTDTK